MARLPRPARAESAKFARIEHSDSEEEDEEPLTPAEDVRGTVLQAGQVGLIRGGDVGCLLAQKIAISFSCLCEVFMVFVRGMCYLDKTSSLA